jgi:hypothetical protein
LPFQSAAEKPLTSQPNRECIFTLEDVRHSQGEGRRQQTARSVCPSRRPDANSARVSCGRVRCPVCQSPMRVIAVIYDPRLMQKILCHLGAWHAPPAGLSPPGASSNRVRPDAFMTSLRITKNHKELAPAKPRHACCFSWQKRRSCARLPAHRNPPPEFGLGTGGYRCL